MACCTWWPTWGSTWAWRPHPDLGRWEDEALRQARQRLEEYLRAHFGDWPQATVQVPVGDPAAAIVVQAQRAGVDLIIMGTHGRCGLDRALFGSVAERVLKHSPVPVLTVNPLRLPLEEQA